MFLPYADISPDIVKDILILKSYAIIPEYLIIHLVIRDTINKKKHNHN